MLNKIKTEVENIDNMPWSILRKNISLNCAAVRRSMGVCTIPGSEMGIKCPVKSMSLSTASDDYDNKSHGKKALSSTKQIQTKYDDATSQTIALTIRVDKETNCNIFQSMSVKSSCEGLKAIFIGLRKVSDHTLLVRWRAPPKVADVKASSRRSFNTKNI
ncbi:unnamed protein product, partial [Brenthis ino]